MKLLKLFTSVLALTFVSQAQSASAAQLEKTSTELFSTGHTRVVKCSVGPSGVSITRTFEGLTSTETKNFTLAGDVDSKIDEVLSTTPTERKNTPSMDLSFAYVAYKTGSTAAVTLGSYDGSTGTEVYNSSTGAGVLKKIMQNMCGK